MKNGILIFVLFLALGKEIYAQKRYVSDDPNYAKNVEAAAEAIEAKDYKKCAKCFERAMKITTKSYYSMYKLAKCHSLNGKAKKAAKWMNKAIEADYETVCTWMSEERTDLGKLLDHKKHGKNILNLCDSKRVAYEATINVPLRDELRDIMEKDQRHRKEMRSVSEEFGWDSKEMKALWAKQTPLDSLNLIRIEEIIAEHGYPGKALVGKREASAAFMVLQHSTTEYQEKHFPTLKVAAEKGEFRKSTLALMEDRILTSNDKPQIYGTQVGTNKETGEAYFFEIKDPENVDSRRAEVGLGSLAEYGKHWDIPWPPVEAPVEQFDPTADIAAIEGEWQLTAIKFYPRDEIIVPTKDYWIEFTADKVRFNKEVNSCHTAYKMTRDGILISPQIGCTKMCCDGDISEQLNYQDANIEGIEDNRLVLKTDDRRFVFERKK